MAVRRLLAVWCVVILAAVVVPVMLAPGGERAASADAAEVFGGSAEPSGVPDEQPKGAESEAPGSAPSGAPPGAVEVWAEADEPAARESVPDEEVIVRVLDGGAVRMLPLGEYLAGVVAAEMPSSFPAAALEAQAVAARSLTHFRLKNPKHEGAEVCTDAGCCMAYGEATEQGRAAVRNTDGAVAVYDGEAIMAAFFAAADGATRSAAEVWGEDVPYLVSVESAEDEKARGHGVGMSQYGAAEMAERGADWREIIEHYYPGAVVRV